MWNPTETNFTHYKIYISNRTFAKEHLIWGMMTEYTLTDLTPGGIYNITVHRIRGNVEGSGTFITVVAGIQIIFDIFLKIHICITFCTVQNKISIFSF